MNLPLVANVQMVNLSNIKGHAQIHVRFQQYDDLVFLFYLLLSGHYCLSTFCQMQLRFLKLKFVPSSLQ